MNKRAILNLTVWVLTSNGLASTIVAQEIKWIVPAAARDQEGDLETSSEGGTGGIFHGLVHAADFNDLPTDYKYITQLSFRPNASVTTPMELKYDNLKIRLSTTSRDSLSTNYGENIGPDATTIYDGSISYFTDGGGPPGGPRTPASIIASEDFMPFYYDPGQGNLLIEWANQAGTTITPAGTIYRSDVQSLPFTGAVGFSLDPPHSAVFQLDTNVVWELTFSSVPEPSSLTLSTVALFGLVCRLCARQRIVKNESNDHAFRNRMSA